MTRTSNGSCCDWREHARRQGVWWCGHARSSLGRLSGPLTHWASAFYQQFLQKVEAANPAGDIYVITDNLSSHNSLATRTWLEEHPKIRHVFIPVGACWLNLQEGWWRIFRKAALAGQSFTGPPEIKQATRLATAQLNARARPWVGQTCPTHQALTPPICVHPLRNPALRGPNKGVGRVGG
ncbi:transposase [Streptomyces bullii]